MNIGVIGAGKLGLPVALAIESKGHEVSVYDVNPNVEGYIADHQIPYTEEGIQPLLDETKIHVAQSIGEIVATSDIVFCAIQTPHDAKYEGTTRLPETREDFDYTFLKKAIGDVALAAEKQKKPTILATISTCLPGTFSREIQPLLNRYVHYVYTPQFIAMGTVVEDYLHPEFDLIGVEDEGAADQLEEFYDTINDAPHVRTDITTAEAIKVSYNTWITAKTVIANLWGEIAHKTGANFDDIHKAWMLSTKRLISPKYMNSGVGDGGGCHPRDNIALSHLARELDLSYDFFESLIKAREEHMAWLGKEAAHAAREQGLPMIILGRSFKPETNIETGSPAVLMAKIVEDETDQYVEHEENIENLPKGVYVIGTQHKRYLDYRFPKGSIVYDPFGFIEDQEGVIIRRIGRNNDFNKNSSKTKLSQWVHSA